MTPNHRLPACLNMPVLGDPPAADTCASNSRLFFSRHLFVVILSCAVGLSGCKPFGTRADSGVDPDDWAPPNRNSYSMPHQFQSKYKNKNETVKSTKADGKPANDAAKAKATDAAPAADSKKAESSVTTSVKKEEVPNKLTSAASAPVETGVVDLDTESAIANLPPHLQELLRNQLAATEARKNQEIKTNNGADPTSVVRATVNSSSPASPPEIASAKLPQPLASVTTPSSPSPVAPPAVQLASNTEAALKTNTPIRMSLSDSSSELANAKAIIPPSTNPVQAPNTPVQSATVTAPASEAENAIHVGPAIARAAEPSLLLGKQESVVPTANQATPPAKSLESGEAMQLAASSIERKLAENPSMDERVRLNYELALRMIHLANNDLEQALKPIDHLQPAEQEYYRYQLQAIYDSGNPEAIPVASRRWSLVMENQRKANQHLASISNLEVRNAAFCTDVQGYGVVTKFQSSMFKPDQDVLLYCELENVSTEQIRDGFETQLQGSYEIVDAQGRRVAEQLLPTEKEICSNQRRDYFVVYRVFMPMQIAAGNYEMRVTIEDMKGKKFGQSNLPFQIQIQK